MVRLVNLFLRAKREAEKKRFDQQIAFSLEEISNQIFNSQPIASLKIW